MDEPRKVVMVVDENLEEVLNADSLIFTQLKGLELLLRELVVMGRVVDQSTDYVLKDPNYLLVERCRICRFLDVVRRVVAILVTLFLLFGFLKELGAVDLENLNFFLNIHDVLLDDLQGFSPLAFVFDLNLD